jgi:hypothetical protein
MLISEDSKKAIFRVYAKKDSVAGRSYMQKNTRRLSDFSVFIYNTDYERKLEIVFVRNNEAFSIVSNTDSVYIFAIKLAEYNLVKYMFYKNSPELSLYDLASIKKAELDDNSVTVSLFPHFRESYYLVADMFVRAEPTEKNLTEKEYAQYLEFLSFFRMKQFNKSL